MTLPGNPRKLAMGLSFGLLRLKLTTATFGPGD